MKIGSTSLIIKKMQIQTSVRYSLTPIDKLLLKHPQKITSLSLFFIHETFEQYWSVIF